MCIYVWFLYITYSVVEYILSLSGYSSKKNDNLSDLIWIILSLLDSWGLFNNHPFMLLSVMQPRHLEFSAGGVLTLVLRWKNSLKWVLDLLYWHRALYLLWTHLLRNWNCRLLSRCFFPSVIFCFLTSHLVLSSYLVNFPYAWRTLMLYQIINYGLASCQLVHLVIPSILLIGLGILQNISKTWVIPLVSIMMIVMNW